MNSNPEGNGRKPVADDLDEVVLDWPLQPPTLVEAAVAQVHEALAYELLETLNEYEESIISDYFGLSGHPRVTIAELAGRLGVSEVEALDIVDAIVSVLGERADELWAPETGVQED